MVRRSAAKNDNMIDPKLKKTFIEMRDHFQVLNERANGAAAKRRQYLKEVKEAGYSLQQIKISLLLQTPDGEAEFKAEMANRLLAAAYSDADIGDQLSLFLDGERTPAADRAYKEGQTAAMKNKAMTCEYAPETDQYAGFVSGYQDEQSRMVKAGIGKLDEKSAAANKAGKNGKGGKSPKAAKKAAAAPAKPAGKRGRPPGSGKAKPADSPPRRPSAAPVTRAGLAAAKASAPADTESDYFTKSEPAGNA